MKKRYRFEFSSLRFFFLIVKLVLAGGLLFSLGLMAGYHLSRSSYEQIIMEASSENRVKNKEKISLLDFSGVKKTKTPPPKTSYSSGAKKPTQKYVRTLPQKRGVTPIPSSSTGVYSVQVGSFKNKTDANRLRNKLRKKKYKAFVILANLGDKGVWYRVRVGRFSDVEEAEKLAETLLKKEKIKGIVLKQ